MILFIYYLYQLFWFSTNGFAKLISRVVTVEIGDSILSDDGCIQIFHYYLNFLLHVGKCFIRVDMFVYNAMVGEREAFENIES